MAMERKRRELAREMPTWVTLSATTPVTTSDGGSELEKHRLPRTNTTSLPRSHTKSIISAREWSLEDLLAQGTRFKAVPRVSALSEPEMLEAIRKHEEEGEPLIIEHWDKHDKWPGTLFSADWLLAHKGDEMWRIHNVKNCVDTDMRLSDFVEYSRNRAKGSSQEDILYGKDAQCPEEWADWVGKGDALPSALRPHGPNDLLRNLTAEEGVESLMCYLGVQDTFTPCHKDLCASSGHNLMCYTEEDGSSFWFMTASTAAPEASEYFQRRIGLELDWEDHMASVEEFANAPFTVYVAEQKLGDLVLVPSRSSHQVVNRGGMTLKTSWSRMTVKGLEAALHHELPIYRRVCRPEQYRVKYIVYRSLIRLTQDLPTPVDSGQPRMVTYSRKDSLPTALRTMDDDLKRLIALFDFILREEYTPEHASLPTVQLASNTDQLDEQHEISTASIKIRRSGRTRTPSARQQDIIKAKMISCNFSCDFCGADIFQSFFECHWCRPIREDDDCSHRVDEGELDSLAESMDHQHILGDGFILCPGCYAEGRKCKCGRMTPIQCRSFSTLLYARNKAAAVHNRVIAIDPMKRHKIISTLQESDIEHTEEVKMFHAGCALLRLVRQAGAKALGTRICGKCTAVGSGGSHPIQKYHGLYCSCCHVTSCFLKILKLGIHSADALSTYSGSRTEWHERHKRAQDEFNRGSSLVKKAERTGEVTIYRDLLVVVARKYTTCRPLHPEFTTLGWYDQSCDTTLGHSASDADEINEHSHDGDLPQMSHSTSLNEPNQEDVPVPRSTSPVHSASDWGYNTTQAQPSSVPVDDFNSPSPLSPLSPSFSPKSIKRSSPLPASAPPRLARRQRSQVYVLMPPLPRLKRQRSVEEGASRKRKRAGQANGTLGHDSDTTVSDSDDERRLQEDYAGGLAAAFSTALASNPKTRKRSRPNNALAISNSAGAISLPPHAADSDDEPIIKGRRRAHSYAAQPISRPPALARRSSISTAPQFLPVELQTDTHAHTTYEIDLSRPLPQLPPMLPATSRPSLPTQATLQSFSMRAVSLPPASPPQPILSPILPSSASSSLPPLPPLPLPSTEEYSLTPLLTPIPIAPSNALTRAIEARDPPLTVSPQHVKPPASSPSSPAPQKSTFGLSSGRSVTSRDRAEGDNPLFVRAPLPASSLNEVPRPAQHPDEIESAQKRTQQTKRPYTAHRGRSTSSPTTEELANVKRTMSELVAEVEKLKTALITRDEAIARLREENQKHVSEINQQKDEIANLRSRVEDLERAKASMQSTSGADTRRREQIYHDLGKNLLESYEELGLPAPQAAVHPGPSKIVPQTRSQQPRRSFDLDMSSTKGYTVYSEFQHFQQHPSGSSGHHIQYGESSRSRARVGSDRSSHNATRDQSSVHPARRSPQDMNASHTRRRHHEQDSHNESYRGRTVSRPGGSHERRSQSPPHIPSASARRPSEAMAHYTPRRDNPSRSRTYSHNERPPRRPRSPAPSSNWPV